jgi:hypothetical protein
LRFPDVQVALGGEQLGVPLVEIRLAGIRLGFASIQFGLTGVQFGLTAVQLGLPKIEVTAMAVRVGLAGGIQLGLAGVELPRPGLEVLGSLPEGFLLPSEGLLSLHEGLVLFGEGLLPLLQFPSLLVEGLLLLALGPSLAVQGVLLLAERMSLVFERLLLLGEGPLLVFKRPLLLVERMSLVFERLLLLAEGLSLVFQFPLLLVEGPFLLDEGLLPLVEGLLLLAESARPGMQLLRAATGLFGLLLHCVLDVQIGLSLLLELRDALAGRPKLAEQAPGPCAAMAVGRGQSARKLLACAVIVGGRGRVSPARPSRGVALFRRWAARSVEHSAGHTVGHSTLTEDLQLDGADAQAVAQGQPRVGERSAVESGVGSEAADHGARGSAEHQAVQRLDATGAEPERAAGPGADRTLRGAEADDLSVPRGAAHPQDEFFTGGIQNGVSGNTNHDHPPSKNQPARRRRPQDD